MGFKPASRVPKPANHKRSVNGIEIKPTLFIHKNGKKLMAGSIDGELVTDSKGKVLPLAEIKHTEIL